MRPAVGGTLDVDSKGNPWATSTNGAIKLDLGNRPVHALRGSAGSGRILWKRMRRLGHLWRGRRPGRQRVGHESGTGSSPEGRQPNRAGHRRQPRRRSSRQRSPRSIGSARLTVRGGQNSAPPGQKAPRRLAADPNADLIWVAMYTSDRLARINTKTNEVKEYPLPTPYSSPYATAVDKNGNRLDQHDEP